MNKYFSMSNMPLVSLTTVRVWHAMIDETVDFTSQSGSTEPSRLFNDPVINAVIY